jgi:hypothetical protein
VAASIFSAFANPGLRSPLTHWQTIGLGTEISFEKAA